MEGGKTEPTVNNISIKYSQFKKIISALKEANPTDDTEISFEFLVGSCFPDIMNNIKKELAYQYTKGYTDALNIDNTKEA